MLRKLLRRCLQSVAEEYWNGWLYSLRLPAAATAFQGDVFCSAIQDAGQLAASPHEEIRNQTWAMEPDSWLFGAWVEGELAGICWVHARDTYVSRGGFFALRSDEAELAQITVAAAFRGRGIATELIRHTAVQMGALGFRKLYAKIWHDNYASRRVFERAGWQRTKRFLSVRLAHRTKTCLFELPILTGMMR